MNKDQNLDFKSFKKNFGKNQALAFLVLFFQIGPKRYKIENFLFQARSMREFHQ